MTKRYILTYEWEGKRAPVHGFETATFGSPRGAWRALEVESGRTRDSLRLIGFRVRLFRPEPAPATPSQNKPSAFRRMLSWIRPGKDGA